jgi:hypothetical protein
MSMLNSWSRKTVRPSFRLSWNQSRQVMRLPVQLWKYSWPTTDSIADVVVVGRGRRIGEDVLGVEEVEPLVLHRPHVEVADGDDHEALEVERQAEARLVPDHRGDERLHRPLGLVEVALAHPDLEQVVLARARAHPLLARDEARRDQREQVARLRERVVPAREVAAVVELAFLDQVAVREQHRIRRLVGADQHRVLGHHVGPVEEEGDAAEALGLALREEAAARGVEAREAGVLLRRAGVADLERERALGRVVDDEHAVLVAERHRFAVGEAARQDDVLAVQAQRRGGHRGVALDLHPARDQRLRRVEVEGEVDLLIQNGGAAYSSRRMRGAVPSRMGRVPRLSSSGCSRRLASGWLR